MDEEYLACLISCVMAGSTNPEAMPREKTKRILKAKPFLRTRIEKSRSALSDTNVFTPEHERVSAVAIKLAQGHALYELHESCASTPDGIEYIPLVSMRDAQREAFENPQCADVWPEVGSRAMQRLLGGTDLTPSGWLNVQDDRYRLSASLNNGIDVRIVIHEYLACHVYWES
jgi:hypothetical protein